MLILAKIKSWFLTLPFASVLEIKVMMGSCWSMKRVRVSEVLMLFAESVAVRL